MYFNTPTDSVFDGICFPTCTDCSSFQLNQSYPAIELPSAVDNFHANQIELNCRLTQFSPASLDGGMIWSDSCSASLYSGETLSNPHSNAGSNPSSNQSSIVVDCCLQPPPMMFAAVSNPRSQAFANLTSNQACNQACLVSNQFNRLEQFEINSSHQFNTLQLYPNMGTVWSNTVVDGRDLQQGWPDFSRQEFNCKERKQQQYWQNFSRQSSRPLNYQTDPMQCYLNQSNGNQNLVNLAVDSKRRRVDPRQQSGFRGNLFEERGQGDMSATLFDHRQFLNEDYLHESGLQSGHGRTQGIPSYSTFQPLPGPIAPPNSIGSVRTQYPESGISIGCSPVSSDGYNSRSRLFSNARSARSTPYQQHTPYTPRRNDFSITYKDQVMFLKMLNEPSVRAFLKWDSCHILADKYLIAMALTYFKRAGLAHKQFTATNLFVALYLAHDMEEDDLDMKNDLVGFAMCDEVNTVKLALFLKKREQLWQAIGMRAAVNRRCCDELMRRCLPAHPVWKRERAEDHGGVNLPGYVRHDIHQQLNLSTVFCYSARLIKCIICEAHRHLLRQQMAKTEMSVTSLYHSIYSTGYLKPAGGYLKPYNRSYYGSVDRYYCVDEE